MFVPVVPIIPNTTVVNKTIVYSDTVLPLKDKGNNLKISSVDVSEYEMEYCLKTIFESNPNVTFNTIQYSRADEKIYFYTDKPISTQAWEKSKVIECKPLKNSKEVLEEITKLFSKDKPKTADCIALYDVVKLYKDVENKTNNIEETYQSYFKGESNFDILIQYFDYEKKQLHIYLNFCNKYYNITLAKQNGDLYVVESETTFYHELLPSLGKDLAELYDELMKFYDFNQQCAWGIKPLNSNFSVDIDHHNINIHDGSLWAIADFELSFDVFDNKYEYNCNSTSVATALQGKEDELFKKIFVKIDDCPEWCRQKLYQIRQKQLKKHHKLKIKLPSWSKNKNKH